MKKARCAIIGAGWWGTTAHVPALVRHPQAELVAIQHHDPATAARIARDFGVPNGCTSAEEVLAIEPLDAVVVSSVPALHHAQAAAALRRGCHVLIEKPMTITAEQADELVALSSAGDLHLILGATWHYTAHCVEARRLIQSGALGELRMISVLMTNIAEGIFRGQPFAEAMGGSDDQRRAEHQPPYLEPGRTSYSDPELAGGGQIYSQASHPSAYISFLTERQPAEVFARFENDGAPVDIYNALTMTLDDGTLVSLATNSAAVPEQMHYELRIFGTEGLLVQELWKGTLAVFDRRGNARSREPLAADEIYPLHAPAENLVDAALGTAENGSPARHGAFAARISEAACESARTGAPVAIRPRPDARAV